jgi:hypothetical protein
MSGARNNKSGLSRTRVKARPSKGSSAAHVRRVPRTWSLRDFENLTPHRKATYTHAIEVLGRVRRGESLSEGARDLGITPATVRRYFPKDFSKPKGSRRWVVSKSDRHVRFVKDIKHDGMSRIPVRGSHEASQQSAFLNAVRKALAAKKEATALAALAPWRGKRIGGRALITSLPKLIALAKSGDLSFEDLYSVGGE